MAVGGIAGWRHGTRGIECVPGTLRGRVRALICAATAACASGALLTGCNTNLVDALLTTGGLVVTVQAAGEDIDPDGFTVTVDGSQSQSLAATGSVSFEGLGVGAHTVELTGVAANCTVDENPQSVTVVGGESVQLAFGVACTALTGDLEVTVTTTGPDPDPDGFAVTVDGTHVQAVAATGSVSFEGLGVGAHTVELTGVAANCTVDENPQSVTVVGGEGVQVAFGVACTALTGDLEVTVTTTGPDPDPDGFAVTVDGAETRTLAATGSVSFEGLGVGAHTVELTGVAANCMVDDNPRTATVVSGESVQVAFGVACAALTGDLEVTVTTTGPDPDPDGYTVTVDGTEPRTLAATGSVSFEGLGVGAHTVELTGVAANCTVDENPQSVTVVGGQSIQAEFGVTCSTVDEPVVLVGAGDIARCSSEHDEATADLLDDIEGTVFTTGDNAYSDGTPEEFAECYHPSWGRHKARTRPSAGNHDYHTPGAAGYYGYFGAASGDPDEGYYSYDLGSWHVVVLNSNIDMDEDSDQISWLVGNLAASTAMCTVAYWHHPRFSSGRHGNDGRIGPIWDVLYAAGVEVVVNGHAHSYERFAPQTPDAVADPDTGIREFVVGTGGTHLRPIEEVQPNSEVRNDTAHGVLKLTLRTGSYDWEFVPIAGQTFTDSGSGACH